MRWIFRATDDSYRAAIADEKNQGRLPFARLTYGFVSGLGWAFLRPWEQHALFPAKGTPFGIGHTERYHEPFMLVRRSHFQGELRHKNHEHPIEGRYWKGYAWRESWGKRWGFWPKFKAVTLDPDLIVWDPHQEDYREFLAEIGIKRQAD